MYAKTHSRQNPDGTVAKVLAICDAALLSKCLSQGEITLDLKSNSAFYKGSIVSHLQATKLIQNALDNENYSINIVGPKAIKAFQASSAERKNFKPKTIAGVPHLQVFKV